MFDSTWGKAENSNSDSEGTGVRQTPVPYHFRNYKLCINRCYRVTVSFCISSRMVSLNYRRHFPAVSLFIFCISLTYCNSQLIGTEGFVQRQPKPLSKLEDLPIRDPMSSVEILESLNVILKNLSSSSLPTITFTKNVSQQCIEDSYFYLEHLMLNATDWAVQSKSLLTYILFLIQQQVIDLYDSSYSDKSCVCSRNQPLSLHAPYIHLIS